MMFVQMLPKETLSFQVTRARPYSHRHSNVGRDLLTGSAKPSSISRRRVRVRAPVTLPNKPNKINNLNANAESLSFAFFVLVALWWHFRFMFGGSELYRYGTVGSIDRYRVMKRAIRAKPEPPWSYTMGRSQPVGARSPNPMVNCVTTLRCRPCSSTPIAPLPQLMFALVCAISLLSKQ
jgi:hypothetical protein